MGQMTGRVAVGLLTAVVSILVTGCGNSKNYNAADVERAFATAKIRLSVMIDAQAPGTYLGSKTLNEISKYGPKILGTNGGTKNMSVLVFPRIRDASAQERSIDQLVAAVHAHPDRYKKYGDVRQIDDNGMARVANVLVLYRKSAPGLSPRIALAVAALRRSR